VITSRRMKCKGHVVSTGDTINRPAYKIRMEETALETRHRQEVASNGITFIPNFIEIRPCFSSLNILTDRQTERHDQPCMLSCYAHRAKTYKKGESNKLVLCSKKFI
jgi:hypothetical protein